MIKIAFKTYGKNIFYFFTILGFITLGVLVAFSFLLPAMTNIVKTGVNEISSTASQFSVFDPNAFINSMSQQIQALDWTDPYTTITNLFTNNGFANMIVTALNAGNLSSEQINSISDSLKTTYYTMVDNSLQQGIYFLLVVFGFSLLGYIAVKVVIHFKTIHNYNIFRFIIAMLLELILNIGVLLLFTYVTLKLTGVWMYLSYAGILLLLFILLLMISFFTYSDQGVTFKQFVNPKTLFSLIGSDVILLAISFGVLVGLYFLNSILAFSIAIPLILMTSILLDNMVMEYVAYINKKEKSIKEEPVPAK